MPNIASRHQLYKDKTGKMEKTRTVAELSCLTAVFLLFVLTSLIHLNKPGIQYDEVLFVNAALGGIDNSFIAKKIGNLPIMLMPYIGALKAYIYFPIFKIFPVSAYTVRIPVIILGALTLFFTYKYISMIFNNRIALMTILLLVFDASFLFQNRLDLGFVSISLFFKSIALFLLIEGIESGHKKYFVFSLLCFGLGLFNKLDFIWFINALCLSAFIIFFREYTSVLRKNIKALTIVIISFFAFFIFYIYVLKMSYALFDEGPLFSFGLMERFKYQFINLKYTLNGNAAYQYTTNTDLGLKSLFLWIGSFMVLLAFVTSLLQRAGRYDRRIIFFILIFFLILIQIYATSRATGPHHIMMLYPFPHLIVAFSINKIIENFEKSNLDKLIASFAYAAVGVVIASNLYVCYQYINAFGNDRTSVMWSNKIYSLIEYVKENNEKTFVSMDWGFHNQLLAFTKGTVSLKEMVWTFYELDLKKDVKSEKKLIDELICKPDHIFLFHEDKVSHFIKAKQNFFDLLKYHKLGSNLTYRMGVGEKYYYEFYEVDLDDCMANADNELKT
jgi:4-amino-4-deoxy-L-arabinose transferase-like glycosyltransferase